MRASFGAPVHEIVVARRGLSNLIQFAQILRIFVRERPDVVVSFGAAPAVGAAVAARLLSIHVVFVETFSAVTRPSLTGRFLRYLANDFIVQWPQLASRGKKGLYAGNVFGFRHYRPC